MDEIERVARAAIEEAGLCMREAWHRQKVVEYKSAIDLVTTTDREIEALIVARLRAAFPDHVIVAEEASAGRAVPRPPADRFAWYLDPVDGTTNFAHAYPQCSISLGLARGDQLLFGIVHDPVRGETFVGIHGAGATLNGLPIHVSTTATLDQSLIGTGFPYDRRRHVDFYLGFMREFMLRTQGVRRVGSAALDLCYVACGRLDGFFEWKLMPWDMAAGALILQEAGGVVSDFANRSFDVHGNQILVSNGLIHAAMVEVLQFRLGIAPIPPHFTDGEG